VNARVVISRIQEELPGGGADHANLVDILQECGYGGNFNVDIYDTTDEPSDWDDLVGAVSIASTQVHVPPTNGEVARIPCVGGYWVITSDYWKPHITSDNPEYQVYFELIVSPTPEMRRYQGSFKLLSEALRFIADEEAKSDN
jgi:hypothetical protein